MLRPLFWQPFWSPGIASVVTATTAESWAFPVQVWPIESRHTLCHGIPDLVVPGHTVNL